MLNISSFCTLSRNPICFKTLTCFPKPPSPQPQFPKRFQNFRFQVFSKHFLCFCFQNPTMSSPAATKIIADYAKSNRSSCKKCTKSISSKALRLGLVSKDPRGFDATKWHHLECFPIISGSVVSAEAIEGFASLESNDQEELNKLVEKCVKSLDEVSDKGKDAVEGSEEKSSKRTRASETDEDDKSEEQQRSSKKTKNLPMSSSSKIVAEYAKSNRSSCKKCTKSISSKALRLGLVSKDPRGFDATKWHHLDCFFPMNSDSVGSAEAIEGFASLESGDQEELKKLVGKCVMSVDEVSDRGKDAVEGSEEKSSKKTRVSETDEDDKSEEQQRSSKKTKNLPMSSSASKVVAEYAKSNRSSCKKCAKKVSAKALRLGLVSKDPRGYDATRWYHLDCFFPMGSDSVGSAEAIEGFASLESSDQEELKKQVGKYVNSVDELSAPAEEAELDVAFSVSDVKNKYKDATLLPRWKAFQTVIFLERDDGLHDSRKIAAFDFDGCLVNTSVNKVGPDAWSLMYQSIPDKLQGLYNDGYKLVIFTNEANIERWKNKRQVAVDSKIGRLNNFIKDVKVPIQVFIACGLSKRFDGQPEDPFRKPKTGMWRIMEQNFNSGFSIDMDQSFYVGDAAGRLNDHSDADIKFAQAIGLKFYVPEDYFCT